MATRSRFTNRARLKKKLLALPPAVLQDTAKALNTGAEDTADLMRRLVPKKTGAAERSIRVESRNSAGAVFTSGIAPKLAGLTVRMRIVAGGHDVFYVRWIEFGTAPHVAGGIFKGSLIPGAPAQPFFYPAYRAKKKSVLSGVRRAGRQAARRVAKSG